MNKFVSLIIAIAAIIGLVVIGSWASRESLYFFNRLITWFRYNWVTLVGAVAIASLLWAFIQRRD